MVIFLETLGAILVAAKILKMTDMSTFMCVLPLIVAAIVQFGTAWLEIKNKTKREFKKVSHRQI